MSLIEQIDKDGVGPQHKSIIDRCVSALYKEGKEMGYTPTLSVSTAHEVEHLGRSSCTVASLETEQCRRQCCTPSSRQLYSTFSVGKMLLHAKA